MAHDFRAGRWIAGLCAAALFFCAHFSVAAEGVTWLTDPAAAAEQAQKQGKLLLVLHLSGDFTTTAAGSREAKIYHSIALTDDRVQKELRQRHVCLWQQVGEPESLRPLSPIKSAAKKGLKHPPRPDYAILYICLPDGRVLHFVPGFLSSEELLAELAWAEKCYIKMNDAAVADEPLAARRAHLAAVAKQDLALFNKRFPSRWKEDALADGPSTIDLPDAFAAARTTLEQSLTVRLGASWRPKDAPANLTALMSHGNFGRELAHQVLAEFPLVALFDLERPAYEACTRQRFWQSSRRRESLADWWQQAAAKNQPVLLVVLDDVFANRPRAASEEFLWPPPNLETLPDLAKFAVEVVTVDELAGLAADARLGPIPCRPTESPPRYVLYDRDGKRNAELVRSTSFSRLSQAMHATVTSGAKVPLAGAEGEETDEE